MNPDKSKYSSLRGSFQEETVRDFLNSVRTGRERVADVEGSLAQLENRAPWDGSDGQVIEEEEFSLEDLGIGGDKEEL